MASRDESVAQLIEIAGISDEAARRLLDATQWNIEEAVALHFAGGSEEPHQSVMATPSPAPPRPPVASAAPAVSRAPANRGGIDPVSDEDDHFGNEPVQRPPVVADTGWFGSFGRSLSNLGQSVMGISSEEFGDWFSSRYGSPTPSFSQECFGESVKCALDQGRLIILWFHQDESPATERLCKDVFQNPIVLRLIKKNYVLWAGDVSKFEPGQIARLLGAQSFPTLVVCQPLRNGYDGMCLEWPLGTFARPLMRLSASTGNEPIDADHAVAALSSAAEDHHDESQARDAQAATRTAQLAEERRLREEQDYEFQESMLMDQMAAVAPVAPASEVAALGGQNGDTSAPVSNGDTTAAAKNAAEEAARAAQLEEEAKLRETERQARAKAILDTAEPPAAGSATAKISLRLPTGSRLQRIFLSDQTLAELYEWAHCCRPEPEPEAFVLCTTYPVQELTDRSASLESLGLTPNSALVLRAAE